MRVNLGPTPIAMALFVNAIVPFAQPAVVQAQSGTSEIPVESDFQ